MNLWQIEARRRDAAVRLVNGSAGVPAQTFAPARSDVRSNCLRHKEHE
jgi:hypothetical protein